MENYKNFITMMVERYFDDKLYDEKFKDVKVTQQGINRLIKTLLNDEEMLNDLDFVVIDRLDKEQLWIESDGDKFI